MSQNANALQTKVITGRVRFSYAHVFHPQAASDGQEEKYSVSILIPKSDKETLQKIKAAVDTVKQTGLQKWGGKLPPNLKTPLRDGDLDKPEHPEYAGHYFLNASSKQKPGIVDSKRLPITDEFEFYSGCYGRASINFFAYSAAGNKGIGCGLQNLQKLEDGEPLGGGRSRAEDDFDDGDDESWLD